MEKLKTIVGFLIFPLLFLTLFLGGNVVKADDLSDKVKLTDVQIRSANSEEKNTIYHLELEKKVGLRFSANYSFPIDVKAGDFFTVKAPPQLDVQDATFDLRDPETNEVRGSVTVNRHTRMITFTFNEKVNDMKNVRGDFVVFAYEQVTKEDKIVTYDLPGGDKQTITFAVKKQEIVPVEGDLLSKNGWNSRDSQIGWNVRINRSKQDLTGRTVKITDKINLNSGAFMSFVEGSFKLHEARYASSDTSETDLLERLEEYEVTTDFEKYQANSDKMAYLKFVDGKKGFELLMPTNTGTKSFFLFYYTSSPTDTSEVENSTQILIDNEPQIVVKRWGDKTLTSTEIVSRLKTVKTESATCTVDIAGRIKITKYDEADATFRLKGAIFAVIRKDTDEEIAEITTDENGIAITPALLDGTYIIREKQAPYGYELNTEDFEVEMQGGKGVPLNIPNKRNPIDFEATKTWVNGKVTDYKEVKLVLYAHKEDESVTTAKPVTGSYTPEVTEANGVYTYKWRNQLPERDVEGTKLVYSIREVDEKTGLPFKEGDKIKVGNNTYVVSYDGKDRVVNTYEVPQTKVTAKKVWSGGKADARPTFYFKLYRTLEGGSLEEVVEADLKEVPKTDGTVEWANLPATDKHGVKYTYSVVETGKDGKSIDGTVNGYTPTQTDATTVTNTYKLLPTTTDIFVDKELAGNRPIPLQANEFEFILKDEDGKEVQRAKNDADGHVVFKDIPFDKEGQYKFTVVEAHAGQTINGVTYDSRSVGVTVSVYDPGHGKLVATPLYDQISALTVPFLNSVTSDSLLPSGAISVIDNGGIQKFVNTYKATQAKAQIAVKKSFVNADATARELKGDEFEFILTDKDGKTTTVKNDKDGNVSFPELTYDKAGVYTYSITEKNAGQTLDGVSYDDKTITATVTVTDNGKGALEATVAYADNDTSFTNQYKVSKTSAEIKARKVLDGKPLTDQAYTFELKENGTVVSTAKNDAQGNIVFNLEYTEAGNHEYTITEVAGNEPGVTYSTTSHIVNVSVTDDGNGQLVATVADADTKREFKNVYTPAGATNVTLGAKKVLDGKTLEAGKYSFELKKEDGTVLETVTNAADGTVTFSPISYDESQVGTHKYTISEVAGTEAGITYDQTVYEVEVTVEKVSATELKATVSKEAKDLVFTNKYTPSKTQVPVKKVWNDADNQDGKRPERITVKLLADGKDTGQTLELSEANSWSGTFTDLDADKGGQAIAYTVEEVAVTGYQTALTGDAASGFTITNSYTPETVDIKAKKNWDDANNQDGKRPKSITINLLADGKKVDSKEVKAAADGTWTAEFKAKAKYKNGKEIKYTITEEKVAEYETTIDNFNIINKYTPKAIEYKVTKVWNDANNQDGKRPESVTVQLYKSVNGSEPVAVDSQMLTLTAENKTDDNTWVASFTNLPQFENGYEITYSIREVNVPEGYTESVQGQVVTNSHEPETIVISGTKVWDDNNNQDGKRTTSVKVQILHDGRVVEEIEVSEATGWNFESKALPKYKDGKEIAYEVKEIAVTSYETKVEKTKDGKYTITNKLTPEKTSIQGRKIWDDSNNQDGIRPDSITVDLYANGELTGKTATASAASGWTYEFTDLDRYKGGKEIQYSVKERVPSGYTAVVNGFTITNSHTPDKPNKPNKPTPPPADHTDKPKADLDKKTTPKKEGRHLPKTGEVVSVIGAIGLAGLSIAGMVYFKKHEG